MKKRLKLLFGLFLAVNLLYLNSCTDDNDPDPTSAPDDRDDFVGLWSVDEHSSIFGNSVYESEIQKNSSIAKNIAIDNFYQLGVTYVTQAVVSGNQLTIPTFTTSTQQVIVGSGKLVDKNTIEFNYTVDDGADVDTVNSVYSRK